MFRVILYMLLAVVLISVLRSVVGVLIKALGSILGGGGGTAQSSSSGPATQLGGDLHRDPICGTFVAESTPFQRRIPNQTFYYCSDSCKEKHALVAR